VSVTGSAPLTFSTSNDTWQLVSYPFVATQGLTQVQIGSTTAGSCGPVIDNVQIESPKCKPRP